MSTSKVFYTGDGGVKVGLIVMNDDVSPRAPRDLSTVLSMALVFTDPNGVKTTYPAVFADFGGAAGDGTDGAIMFWTDSLDFFDLVGTWFLQAYITLADCTSISTERASFSVNEGASAAIVLQPELLLAPHQIAWYQEDHTIGNPGRLGTWLDRWGGALGAVSVAAGGGPARTLNDPLFGSAKTSWLYDGTRKLEAGLVTDFNELHNGVGSTFWVDLIPFGPTGRDNVFMTGWNEAHVGMQLIHNADIGALRWRVYNTEAQALFDVITPAGSAPNNVRTRVAIDWMHGAPGPDYRIYVNNVLVASGDAEFGHAPSAADSTHKLEIGNSRGLGLAFNGKLAEMGFARGCIAREIALYMSLQP